MTLALLLTAVTGAWAEGTVTVTEIKASEMPTSWDNNNNPVKATDLPGFTAVTRDEAKALGAPAAEGDIYVFYAIFNNAFIGLHWNNGVLDDPDGEFGLGAIYALKDVLKFYYVAAASSGLEVAWDASTKTGTFAMPASDVVLTPIYAKAAAFATTGTEPEAKTLLPEAAEGVIAGTDASLIAEGTGIVAFAGTSTEVTQGTLMYAIGTSATEAPALTAFSATVPTAKDIADDGATLYVWYYIQGADAPDGVAATLDNTFDNTEPAYLTVQVLTNKFDIQFNAANANTIEAGKATVTVGGTAATVTEGKLQGVKMGSEVKVKANTGYKFRKVEVKKKAAEPVADIVWDVTNVSDLRVQGDFLIYEKEGVTLSGNADNMEVNWVDFGDPTTDGISFMTNESGGFTFTAPTGKAFTKIEMKALGSFGWAQENIGTGWAYFGDDKNKIYKVTWTGSAASTVKLLTGTDNFFGDYISSIAFYLVE